MPATTLADRAVVRLAGEGVRDFLQGLVTNDVNGPLPVWAGLLTPQGKVLFDFIVWEDGDDVLLDCEAEQTDALIGRLSLYRLRRPLQIMRDDALAVHWSREPLFTTPDPRLQSLGFRALGPLGDPTEGYHEHRLRSGVPEGVGEFGSGETLWLECNARELNGVSFAKGCYVGQENTARMHHREKVNRRLFVLPLGTAPEDRIRARYDALGLEVAHMRVEEVAPELWPAWLSAPEP